MLLYCFYSFLKMCEILKVYIENMTNLITRMVSMVPREDTSILGGRGGLGPHMRFGGKIWGKVQPNSPNKRKNLGSSVTIRGKSWEKSQFWGHV